ncbi:hypothetical protein LH464_19810 [Neorhizobium sp. T786]|uniref:hypothetical protein n=1 Tax=Pseudorhizobium xiangyangii TaxID=2883104 RepID=UPI001D000FFD|nr:hypothetical protein [Neorhizobium xiangyangii]MCB5204716.1 hypothetical protein [Neorhizobium xiangyangii]
MAVENRRTKPTSFRWYNSDDIAACKGVLDGARLHAIARRAWADIASGKAYGLKSAFSQRNLRGIHQLPCVTEARLTRLALG